MSDSTETDTVAPARQRVEISRERIWFLATSALTFHGAMMWYWYPDSIRREKRIQERPELVGDYDTASFDKTWALGTKEMRAWSWTSEVFFASFGTGWCLWLANEFLDNEGGDIHRIFYRFAQFQAYVLPLLIFQAGAELAKAHS